ncbi:glycosyltransferase family 2 protein [Novosphingobium sp. ERN07]|uniref:glycosyltransferase family 2 protein n=1 Tax=Novosphingobium sp. ERN07 TaxID=2726187 RepID=UPI001F0E85F5|nr:glycosyltransferase family 2 protein [Novosphingobium sp. ERN07]
MKMETWNAAQIDRGVSLGLHDIGPAPALSVVIPCYNEEANLDLLVERTTAACRNAVGNDFEIVLINDGSRDRTWPVMADHAGKNRRIVAVNLSANYGHQLALSAGLQLCRGDTVMVMDADLQDPPELLPAFLAKMAEGHDVVYGQRVSRAGETAFKKATASVFYRLMQRMVDVPIPRDTGDFRVMSRRVVDHLNAMPERYRFIRGMVSLVGFSQVALPYEREARFAGESNYPLKKMIAFALDAITSFSTIPLRITTYLGLIAGAMGLVTLGWVFISWLLGMALTGWTSLAGLVLIIGSLQLMMLGIFGEYLGRMYMESKRRPLFIIDEVRAASTGIVAGSPIPEMQIMRQAING